jgi:hypothetical protein
MSQLYVLRTYHWYHGTFPWYVVCNNFLIGNYMRTIGPRYVPMVRTHTGQYHWYQMGTRVQYVHTCTYACTMDSIAGRKPRCFVRTCAPSSTWHFLLSKPRAVLPSALQACVPWCRYVCAKRQELVRWAQDGCSRNHVRDGGVFVRPSLQQQEMQKNAPERLASRNDALRASSSCCCCSCCSCCCCCCCS